MLKSMLNRSNSSISSDSLSPDEEGKKGGERKDAKRFKSGDENDDLNKTDDENENEEDYDDDDETEDQSPLEEKHKQTVNQLNKKVLRLYKNVINLIF
jgi:hypothetical protein